MSAPYRVLMPTNHIAAVTTPPDPDSHTLTGDVSGSIGRYTSNQPGITARREHVTIYHAGRREYVTVSSLQT